jgi:NADPH-dependent curcumin reductase
MRRARSQNTQVRLVRRPVGPPQAEDFEVVTQPIAQPGPGELLVRTLYLSVDPALRPRMEAVSEYAGALSLHEVVPSPALGIVEASGDPAFNPGDHVAGSFGWQSYALCSAREARRIDPDRAPLPKWLSLLGLSAFTAWVGITLIGRPVAGETVVVSAATGATGAVAGQIARILGARAAGIAGGAQKCRAAVELFGYDACVDHRAPDFADQLSAACPDGIDVDFENVGGEVLARVHEHMAIGGRMVICGLVSEYSRPEGWLPGPSLWPAVYKSLRIEGFRASRYFHLLPQFTEQALDWAGQGLLTHREHITEGIEHTPQAFVDMLAGRHFGKAMVKT